VTFRRINITLNFSIAHRIFIVQNKSFGAVHKRRSQLGEEEFVQKMRTSVFLRARTDIERGGGSILCGRILWTAPLHMEYRTNLLQYFETTSQPKHFKHLLL